MNRILVRCDELVVKKQGGGRSHWHPIFGWYCEPLGHSYVSPYSLLFYRIVVFSFLLWKARETRWDVYMLKNKGLIILYGSEIIKGSIMHLEPRLSTTCSSPHSPGSKEFVQKTRKIIGEKLLCKEVRGDVIMRGGIRKGVTEGKGFVWLLSFYFAGRSFVKLKLKTAGVWTV